MSVREIELKFEAAGDVWERARRRCLSLNAPDLPTATDILYSQYYDTADHALHRHGISWRQRRAGGHIVQTIKRGTGVRGGASQPIEYQFDPQGRAAQAGNIPDAAVRARLLRVLGGRPLRPVFAMEVERTVCHLAIDGGVVEVAFDKGHATAGPGRQPVQEIEFELKQGEPQILLKAAEMVFEGRWPRAATRNKAGLGYAMLGLTVEKPPQPHKPQTPKLKKACSSGEAFEALLHHAIDQVLGNWRAVLDTDDLEGPHQMRIGLRRLRTLLKAVGPLLHQPSLEGLNKRLRDFGRLVGTLRDADVQALEMAAPIVKHADWGAAAEPLQAILVRRRDAARAAVRAALVDSTNSRLQSEIALLPATLTSAGKLNLQRAKQPARHLAAGALDKAWHRVKRRGKMIDQLDAADRHGLRKDCKKLRYTAEFFASLYPAKRVAVFVQRLSDLQDMLGYLNDVAVAEVLSRDIRREGDPAGIEALAYVIGWHTARAEQHLQDAAHLWRRVQRGDRFW